MIRSRLAPTPSGYLHTGNAFNFVLTWLLQKKAGGSLRLRIDDLDAPRVRTEYLDDVFRTLEWLGLDWDEGPRSSNEQKDRYAQQLRVSLYNRSIEHLIESGNVFACTCSRKEITEQNEMSQYPGTCRHKNIPLNHPDACLRLLTPEHTVISFDDGIKGRCTINLYNEIRDFVIRRRDGLPAYHIASLTDDIVFGISLIVRGEDLLPATAAQLFMAKQLPKNNFAQTTFMHHRLFTDAVGNKLSKSAGSASVRALRNSESDAGGFYSYIAGALGWWQKPQTAQQMLKLVGQGQPLY